MCGIFGFLYNSSSLSYSKKLTIVQELYKISESRGKEASGLLCKEGQSIDVLKSAVPGSEFIKTLEFENSVFTKIKDQNNGLFIGHSRLVTNGRSDNNLNNQPVVTSQITGVHNGIVSNSDELSEKYNMQLQSELDSEVLFKILDGNLKKNSLYKSLHALYEEIEGVANIATILTRYNSVLLATNNGSLYVVKSIDGAEIIFGSERFILESLINKCGLERTFNKDDITKIKPWSGQLICIEDLSIQDVDIRSSLDLELVESSNFAINDVSKPSEKVEQRYESAFDVETLLREYDRNKAEISKLQRCTKCILPETMPFIKFDHEGVCNYCNNYKKHKVKGKELLAERLKHSSHSGEFDCLVTLSGGRDSCYGLHYITEELNLNPVTYTYDWGMVTDLARRNQMRMCGKLGTEHILVSADIEQKRNNIRKNVEAWLSKPELGMIPLFMAGDKQYFYWSNKIAEQTKVDSIILCENLLETTMFKSGFCGIKPSFGGKNTYSLSILNKLKMISYYLKNFILNPRYLNSSLFDTFSAFSSYYVMKHDFINLFDYIEWDEAKINSTLLGVYNWEKSQDTESTWRIGDGTAAFYNYIYYTLAGLTENDTFRSNQIREGKLSREEALRLSEQENYPRAESIKWYLDTIGVDFNTALESIHNARKLY